MKKPLKPSTSWFERGKTLYVGISNYNGAQTAAITKIFKDLHTPFIIHQPRYNMFDRHIEDDLLPVLKQEGKAAVCFSPLAQGLLTDRYLNVIPADSRAAKSTSPFLHEDQVEQTIGKVKQLNEIAASRHQTLAEMAVAWNLREPEIACVLIGASRPSQLVDDVKTLNKLSFTPAELAAIDRVLAEK